MAAPRDISQKEPLYLRVIGPMRSKDSAKASTAYRLTRSQVGLIPTMPQAADGNLILPPV